MIKQKAKYTRLLFILLTLTQLSACDNIFSGHQKKERYKWPIIAGFPKPQVPQNNPMSQDKVALGRALFYDVNLSANQQQSCASCHIQKYAFSEPKSTSTGSTGQAHRRNSPALVNIAYNKTLTWAHDGLTSLEQQILLPMFGEFPIELGITGNEKKVLERFNTSKYSLLFNNAFPKEMLNEDVNFDMIVKALSSFVRSLLSLNSPFDQYAYYGDDNAISASALRGMQLFFSEKLECHHCHGGFNFTQSTSHQQQLIDRRPFHNTGLYNVENGIVGNSTFGYPKIDIGLAEITGKEEDNGRFRAPTLRNIEVTAPYMHDGSISDLSAVLEFYAAGGRNIKNGEKNGDGRNNTLKSSFIKGFDMSQQDKEDLLVFLKSLTDDKFLTNQKFSEP